MDMRLAPGVGAPGEGAVGERDLEPVALEQQRPELGRLLALGDRIRGDETDPRRSFREVFPGAEEPGRHIVERAAAAAEVRDPAHLFPLFRRLVFGPVEGRIAEDEGATPGIQHARPVRFQRVGREDAGGLLQRDADEGLPELQAQAVVHDVIHHPERRRRDPGRELAEFDPVELVHLHLRERRHIERLPVPAQLAQQLDLQGAQFPVGDDEEVAATAGRVEELHGAQALPEGEQRGAPAPVLPGGDPAELGAEVVEEERLDDLQDVPFGGVVGALFPPFDRVHDGLEERAEDRRGDLRPVEPAGVEERPAHGAVEGRNGQRAPKEVAVDMGEARQVLVERGVPVFHRRVEHLEELRQRVPQVGPVLPRAALQQVEEQVAGLEDAGVVREEAEQQPDQEALQRFAGVPGVPEAVVEAAHEFRGFDVDRILVAESPPLDAEDEPELLDVLREVGEREGHPLPFVAVVEVEGAEVGEQPVARAVPARQRVEVGVRLFRRGVETAAGALLLHEQHARPEQIHEAPAVVESPNLLFVAGDAPPFDAEDAEERLVERLRLALLVGSVRPVAGELRGAGADLVPGEAHRLPERSGKRSGPAGSGRRRRCGQRRSRSGGGSYGP